MERQDRGHLNPDHCVSTITGFATETYMSSVVRLENRNAYLIVYDDSEGDVIPPFIVGEIAGSLRIPGDRQKLKEFSLILLDWLERTEVVDDNVIRNVRFG